MKLKKIGFFRELGHGDPDGPILKEMIQGQANYDKDLVIQYLTSAPLLIGCPGLVNDVLVPGSPLVVAPHIKTDGIWVWPNDLAYYVEKYNLVLDADFLADLKKNDYVPPSEKDLDLSDLEF